MTELMSVDEEFLGERGNGWRKERRGEEGMWKGKTDRRGEDC